MAATSQKAGLPVSEEPPCPDPSVHNTDPRLQDQASKAALYVTHSEKGTGTESTSSPDVLGPDGKLSSASAATSLKYAKPQDLPAFPTVGIDTTSSGNKAANLANSNPRKIEPWQPELSSNASKAALLAARDGGKLNLWQHQASGTGFSAASIAMSKPSSSPTMDRSTPEDSKRKALLAATKSISSNRTRSTSNPVVGPPRYPDEANSSYNALNAATVANRPSSRTAGDPAIMSSPANEAARVKNLHQSRDMYTEHPPVAMEVEEKKHNDALRASAVSMAKQMYEKNQRDEAEKSAGLIAATRSQEQARMSTSSDDVKSQAVAYLHLQDAAQKLAAERLAKLDPDGVLAYREHYGYGQTAPKSKLSLRGRHRKSRSVEDADFSDDEQQASRIRGQMSTFNEQVAAVDAKKRTTDRENLMAAAQRSVQAQMQVMDDKVFLDTGKVPPAMLEDWHANARAKAMADSDKRMENHGKIHIGGGKFMHQSEVDAIAQERMQPTLDEISEEAERQRARDEQVRLDIERRKAEAETERQRERDTKAELKRQRDEEKAEQRAALAAEKQRAQEEKEQRKLRERMAKAEQKQIEENRELERKLDANRAKDEEALDKEREKNWVRGKEGAEIDRERMQEAERARGEADETREITTGDDAVAEEHVVAEDAPVAASSEPVAAASEPVAPESITPSEPVHVEDGYRIPGTDSVLPAERFAPDEAVDRAESPHIEEPVAAESSTDPTTTSKIETVSPTSGLVSSYDNAQALSMSKRDSRLKGFFSKLKRSSKTPSSDTPTSPTEDAPVASGALGATTGSETVAQPEATAKSPSISPASSTRDLEPMQTAETGENHEEAKDHVDELSAPRASFAQSSVKDEGSPARTSSKFQEEL